ncbi:MAG: glycoside hydrolase family 125 protein, partial [Candidatus Promineifilaceae bacterium]
SRASYTQLTEKGVLHLPPAEMALRLIEGELALVAPGARAAAVIRGLPAGARGALEGQAPLGVEAEAELALAPGQVTELVFVFALGRSLERARTTAGKVAAAGPGRLLRNALNRRQRRWRELAARLPAGTPVAELARRAQEYIWDECAVPVGDGICLITDHQLLPLSWTRDAYFLLQALDPRAAATQRLNRRHLRWLFESARRPDGYWGRTYLANGRPKDAVFQLDQQCYPLLELAEYALATQDEPTLARLLPGVPAVLGAILARQAPAGADGRRPALFASEETPGDDPMPLPYHSSSHILLWRTLEQLAAVDARWPFSELDLGGLAAQVRAAVGDHLVAEHAGRRLFAYAADGRGNYHFYHDANDLPLALAPIWGFCPATDPIWRATMAFAFSPENRGGHYAGPAGGLGSVHTPGAWPLGDVQEYLYGRLIGEEERAAAALRRLAASAFWDGALPEARDPESGRASSRHWFAWPGAALLAAVTRYRP